MSKESLFYITGVIKGCFTAMVLSTLSLLIYHEYILFPSVTCICEFTLKYPKESIAFTGTAVWNQVKCFGQSSLHGKMTLFYWHETISGNFWRRILPLILVNEQFRRYLLTYRRKKCNMKMTLQRVMWHKKHLVIFIDLYYRNMCINTKHCYGWYWCFCVDSLRRQQANIDTCT